MPPKVVDAPRERRVPAHCASKYQRRNVVRRPALVEDDEDRGARLAEQRRDEPAKPCIAGRDGTAVHVVAEVGDDEREVGQVPRLEP